MGEEPASRPHARVWRATSGADTPYPSGSAAAARADQLLAEYGFLLAGGFDAMMLREAIVESIHVGIPPHRVLIRAGNMTAARYLAALQNEIALHAPHASMAVTEVVDGLASTPAVIANAAAAIRSRGRIPILLSPEQIDWSETPEIRHARAEDAANGLKRRQPHLSAGRRFATWQLIAAPVVLGLVMGGTVMAPDAGLAVLAGLVAGPFLLVVGLRVLSLLVVLRIPLLRRTPARLPDAELPIYSVMVPLFREAEVLPDLIAALLRLDYPTAKLDIMVVLEAVDGATQAAADQLTLPPHIRVVVVPDLQPRTKPKALNYALQLARGEFVVVYDAEDDPEPDQLRRALASFLSGPANLMCVQARLSIDNPSPGWLARQFMLEYTALFDAMLPALVRLRLPVPLGGTSNHFSRRAIEALDGWDAYNVTEDADLGVRIARLGGCVAVLDSTTYEEAPEHFRVWLPQRTRWMKGFMLTWLVHMRDPARLLAELGPMGFLGFNVFLGGIVLSSLIHPIFVALLLLEAFAGRLMLMPETLLGGAVMTLAIFNLVAGYASGMAMAGLAASRRGLIGLVPHVVMMPLYWMLISLAAYRALLQLITNPYLWEKTPHVRRRRPGSIGV